MPSITIEPTSGWRSLRLRELLAHRELVYFLAWRDVKVRYKQTVLGAAWALLQPVLLMVVFTVIFGRVAGVASEGVPYPLFSLAALVPWTFFAQTVLNASESLVASSNLVSKVYFPRLAIPIGTAGSHLIDLGIGLAILAGAMAYYATGFSVRLLVVPLMCILLFVCVAALGIGLAAINVRYRDVRYAVPFLVQVLLFVSPVAYSSVEIGRPAILLYAVNPMAGVIEGFRWGILNVQRDPTDVILVSSASALILLVVSLAYFAKVEKTFADVI